MDPEYQPMGTTAQVPRSVRRTQGFAPVPYSRLLSPSPWTMLHEGTNPFYASGGGELPNPELSTLATFIEEHPVIFGVMVGGFFLWLAGRVKFV